MSMRFSMETQRLFNGVFLAVLDAATLTDRAATAASEEDRQVVVVVAVNRRRYPEP
ncbi:hypothetical protein EMGBS8_10930 [Verrucomicrobiota bacterium]|nr:hypothetical protein EMGBS8_10930 [Verrucomicrobiota bacterium]